MADPSDRSSPERRLLRNLDCHCTSNPTIAASPDWIPVPALFDTAVASYPVGFAIACLSLLLLSHAAKTPATEDHRRPRRRHLVRPCWFLPRAHEYLRHAVSDSVARARCFGHEGELAYAAAWVATTDTASHLWRRRDSSAHDRQPTKRVSDKPRIWGGNGRKMGRKERRHVVDEARGVDVAAALQCDPLGHHEDATPQMVLRSFSSAT